MLKREEIFNNDVQNDYMEINKNLGQNIQKKKSYFDGDNKFYDSFQPKMLNY